MLIENTSEISFVRQLENFNAVPKGIVMNEGPLYKYFRPFAVYFQFIFSN